MIHAKRAPLSAKTPDMAHRAAALIARLDRLPMTRHMWMTVTLLSLGGIFEYYDLFLTGYIVPALVRDGLLTNVSLGIFAGPAVFVAATFAGLWIGTLLLGFVADRFGRRSIFTFSLLWYSIANVIMALQHTGEGIALWRLIAGIGIGIELVTIDSYIAEIVSKDLRGQAFAFNQAVQFAGVPIVALLSYLLVPREILGLEGWRWVVLIGSLGAVVVWVLRLGLKESPRWLVNHGHLAAAEEITAGMEKAVKRDLKGASLPSPKAAAVEVEKRGRFADIWQPPYRKRTVMLMVFLFFQSIGFYGFANWVPTLIAQKGINLSGSLLYSFVIACANPFGPILAFGIADRIERKWLIVWSAVGTAVFGMLFALQNSVASLIAFGVAITVTNNIMSFAFHAYQSELFPTRVRARAVGFVYSFSRLSIVFVSFMIAFILQWGGVSAVFIFIAFAMIMVVISIGGFGPDVRARQLEDISR
ncbi:MAG: MFS transporter [Dongiaceae bacterium]